MTMLVFEDEGVPVVTTAWTVVPVPHNVRQVRIFYLSGEVRPASAILPMSIERFLHIVREGDVADLRGVT